MINILARLVKRDLSELQEQIDKIVDEDNEKAMITGKMMAYQKVLHYIEDITGRSMPGSANNSHLFNTTEQKKDGLGLDDILKSLGEGFKKMKDKPGQE